MEGTFNKAPMLGHTNRFLELERIIDEVLLEEEPVLRGLQRYLRDGTLESEEPSPPISDDEKIEFSL